MNFAMLTTSQPNTCILTTKEHELSLTVHWHVLYLQIKHSVYHVKHPFNDKT